MIRDFSISYVTHGQLNDKKSNAILMDSSHMRDTEIPALDQNQNRGRGAWYEGRIQGGPMRFFFNIQDRLQIEDEVGREFSLASEAVAFAKHLAADIRCLETAVRPTLTIEVVAETAERIHRESVFA